MLELLTLEQLSELVHKAVSTLQSDLSRAPERLPPVVKLPGNRRALFRRADVEAWINRHVALPTLPHEQRVKRRGRPTKAEQLSRQRASKGASHG